MFLWKVIFLLSCVLVEEVLCQTGLTDADKQAILNTHNTLRGQVSPAAANMKKMVWDDELATIAQNYTEKCVFAHNGDRSSKSTTFTYVGENIAAGTGAANFPGFVQMWYNEVQNYNFDSNSCNSTCGHYTQTVWATSRNVGCGAYRCSKLNNVNMSNVLIFVCDYGPGGNMKGQKPYVAGSSCSACSADVPLCVDKLCSVSSQ